MKVLLFLPISLCFLFPTINATIKTYKVGSVCESFAAGKIDALRTLQALDLNIDFYSIGLDNIAKIFCA